MTDFASVMDRRRRKEAGTIWADEVIRNALYLGSGQDASNLIQIQRHGVTHVINVADDVPNFFDKAGVVDGDNCLTYLSLNVGDFGTDKGISRVFPEAAAFANAAIESGGKVLVHCANGSNRSASVVTAVLMMSPHNLSLDDAYKKVKAARREANPLTDNRRELFAFEASLHGGSVSLTEEQWMAK